MAIAREETASLCNSSHCCTGNLTWYVS